MARGKNASAGRNTSQGNGSGPANMMEGVRMALRAKGRKATPLEIQEWLKTTHNMKMDRSLISNYKSSILKKGFRGRVGRPPKAQAVGSAIPVATVAVRVAPSRRTDISLDDVRKLKELTGRIGARKVKELAIMVGRR
jgi:hypothetical protein